MGLEATAGVRGSRERLQPFVDTCFLPRGQSLKASIRLRPFQSVSKAKRWEGTYQILLDPSTRPAASAPPEKSALSRAPRPLGGPSFCLEEGGSPWTGRPGVGRSPPGRAGAADRKLDKLRVCVSIPVSSSVSHVCARTFFLFFFHRPLDGSFFTSYSDTFS